MDPVSSNPASVFLTAILSPPLIYVVVALILMCLFLVLVCVFKEEMKPCLFSTLDVLACIGMICFNILTYIWSWVKTIVYPVKECILNITDKEVCRCCGFRFKNCIFFGGRAGTEVYWGRKGDAPSRPEFTLRYASVEERKEEGKLMKRRQEQEDYIAQLNKERQEKTAGMASASAAPGSVDEGFVKRELRTGKEYAEETGQEMDAVRHGATGIVTGGVQNMAAMPHGSVNFV